MKPILSTIAIVALLVGCATFETSAYRSIGITAHTVDVLMTTWADESVAGRTTPQIDAAVTKAYTNYQSGMAVAKIAIDGYRGGTNSQERVTATLSELAKNKEALRNLILSLALPAENRTKVLTLP